MNTFRFLLIATLTAVSVKNIHCVDQNKTVAGQVTVNSPTQLAQYTSPVAEGFLDRLTFATPQQGGNGTATSFVPFSISGSTLPSDLCNAIALQPDGCLLLAGKTVTPNGSSCFAVTRYLPDGQLDPTFGQVGTARAGTAYVPFSITGEANFDIGTSIVVQPDGKIILGGRSENGAAVIRFAIARFTPDGTLDTTFGQVGTAQAGTTYVPFSIAPGGGDNDAYSIALQPDGTIILGGRSEDGGGASRFAVACFTPGGTLDINFGQVGTARAGTAYVPFSIVPGGGDIDIANALSVQADGKMVLGGTSRDGGGVTRFAVARFTSNGVLDTNFGQVGTAQAGTAYVPFSIILGGTNSNASSVALQPDGRIILGGTGLGGGVNRFAIACFTSDGALDINFGQIGTPRAGSAYINFTIAGGTNDESNGIAIQSDNKILLSGYSRTGAGGTPNYFALARFLPNGILDTTTFGNVGGSTAGTTYIPFSISGQTAFDQAKAAVLQPDGKIALAGFSSDNDNDPSYFAVARLVGALPN